MAEAQMAAVQRARRNLVYDSGDEYEYDDDDDVSSVDINSAHSGSRQYQQSLSPNATRELESFDPYQPEEPASQEALFDATAFELSSMMVDKNKNESSRTSSSAVPGGAGYLEIEEEPPRPVPLEMTMDNNEPIRTSSGLLLTHRRTSPTTTASKSNSNSRTPREDDTAYDSYVRRREAFEMENGLHGNPRYGYSSSGYGPSGRHSMTMTQAKQLLSYARLWVVVCFGALLITTGALMHSFGHNSGNPVEGKTTQKASDAAQGSNPQDLGQFQNEYGQNGFFYQVPDQVLLLPMENISQLANQQRENTPLDENWES